MISSSPSPRSTGIPSVREIGAAMGSKSPSTVHFSSEGPGGGGHDHQGGGQDPGHHPPAAPRRTVAEESGARTDRIPVVGNVRRFPILAEECIEDYLTFDTQGLSGEHFALKVRASP